MIELMVHSACLVQVEIMSLEVHLPLHRHRHPQADQHLTHARQPFPTSASTMPGLLSRLPTGFKLAHNFCAENLKLTYKNVVTPTSTMIQVIPDNRSRPVFLFRPPVLLRKKSCTGDETKVFKKLISPSDANPFMKCSLQPD
jgi:hypothetical protein